MNTYKFHFLSVARYRNLKILKKIVISAFYDIFLKPIQSNTRRKEQHKKVTKKTRETHGERNKIRK